MEVKALQQMLSQFRQVQEKLEKQIGEIAVESSAGGGMVSVKMNGQKQLVSVRIEPEVFKSKDQEMLQELVLAAVNEATRRVDEEMSKQVKDLTGGFPGTHGENPRTLLTGMAETGTSCRLKLPSVVDPLHFSFHAHSATVAKRGSALTCLILRHR